MFNSDYEAWEFLESKGFLENNFIIQISKDKELTDREIEALDYLCDEWDWGVERECK